MFNKLKKAMVDSHNEKVKEAQERQDKSDEEVSLLIEANITNPQDYTFGVAQMEERDKRTSRQVLSAISNTIYLNCTDYIVGVNNTKREVVILEVHEGNIMNKQVFENDFKCSKDSYIGNELKNTLKKHTIGRTTGRYVNSHDRYKRDKFTIKSDSDKVLLLIGNFLPEATNYPYDNTKLIESLKGLK